MKGKHRQNRRRPEGDTSEFGAVKVISNPAPDAEDRLRRIFTILLEHAARERQATPDDSDAPTDDLAEAES